MKFIQTICFSLTMSLMAFFASCENNDDIITENEDPTQETDISFLSYNTLQIKETISNDTPSPVTLTQMYNYEDGKLVDCVSTQTYTAIENFEISHYISLLYSPKQVSIHHDDNQTSIYTLNDKGYATKCVIKDANNNARHYTFKYHVSNKGKHYLSEIQETMDNGTPYSSIKLAYDKYPNIQVTQTIEDFEQTYECLLNEEASHANIFKIPSLFLSEMHPISQHDIAYHGEILGEHFDYLMSRAYVKDSTEGITYTYKIDPTSMSMSCEAITCYKGKLFTRSISYNAY